MSLAPYVRILGRGPGRSRSMTREEATEAMRLILADEAEPHAIGALLMLMRYRGETAEEIAGFVSAMRAELSGWAECVAAIDWPSYAAGRSRGQPYFLCAAKLVAQAGLPVLLHGWNSHQQRLADVRAVLGSLDIPVTPQPEAARIALKNGGIAYVPLESLDGRLFDLLHLRDVLGLRSAVNTALRLLNPAAAPVSVQGVFHPPYRDLQCDAGMLLGQAEQMVIKGGGGEFERNPAKQIALHRVTASARDDLAALPLLDESRRLAENAEGMPTPRELWSGSRSDEFAEAIVTGTAALALLAAGRASDLSTAEAEALALWRDRTQRLAA